MEDAENPSPSFFLPESFVPHTVFNAFGQAGVSGFPQVLHSHHKEYMLLPSPLQAAEHCSERIWGGGDNST